jgi:hypothetical protein
MDTHDDFEQHAYETSSGRAKQHASRTRIKENVVRDFSWSTGLWYWMPKTEKGPGLYWNPSSGPALKTKWKKTYWLCLGWSRIEILPVDDPVDTIQNGGLGNGGA